MLILLEEEKKIVLTILKEHRVCINREVCDRAWNDSKLYPDVTSLVLECLEEDGILEKSIVPSGYGKPFHFYFFLDGQSKRNEEMFEKKMKLLSQHRALTEEIGQFGANLVATIMERIGYNNIETNKKTHNDVGIGRREIDVWGKHKLDYYHNIEVKNRRQPTDTNHVDSVESKSIIASRKWRLPVKSAIVCSFIYGSAFKEAKKRGIPVVITKKQFVPRKYEDFYMKYRNLLGSYYVEIVDSNAPPERLVKKFEKYIFNYNYD